MEMNIGELFQVMQFIIKIDKKELREKIMLNIESKILEHLLELSQGDYEGLFKMLNFMRMHDLSPKVRPEMMKKI